MKASWSRVLNVTTTATSASFGGIGPAAAARPSGTESSSAERTRRPLLKRKIVPATGATLSLRADVAELVDAHGSGPCGRKPVEVQVLSSALGDLARLLLPERRLGRSLDLRSLSERLATCG